MTVKTERGEKKKKGKSRETERGKNSDPQM